MEDIMETVKSGFLIKRIDETIKNEAKEKRPISSNLIRKISC